MPEQNTLNRRTGVVENISEKAKDIGSTAGNIASQAKEKAQEWTAAASEKVGQARERVQQWTGEKFGETKEKVQEWAGTAAEKAGEVMKDAGQELTSLIRRYPLPALLIGVGLGFVMARALRRD